LKIFSCNLILFLLISFAANSLFAEEVDDFTAINRPTKNAALVIDTATNSLFDDLVDLLNSKEMSSCDDQIKYALAIKKLDQNFTAIGNGLRAGQEIRQLFELIKKDPDNKKDYLQRLQNVQQTWLAEFAPEKRDWFSKLFSSVDYFGPRESKGSIYEGLDYLTCCTNRINVNGTYVGLDKIDHFFGNGGLLFEQYLKNKSIMDEKSNLENIMKINVRQEHSLWGLNGLSPKSYGDLASNWQGLRFYQQLFDGETPYIRCSNGRFSKNQITRFKIKKYLDESWNESYNCSSFGSQKELDKFQTNLKKTGMQCPANQGVCDQLTKKHKSDPLFVRYALNPLCNKQTEKFLQIESKEKVTWDEVELSFRGFTGRIIRDLLERKIILAIYSLFPKMLKPATIKALAYEKEIQQATEVFNSMQTCIQIDKSESLKCLASFTEPGIHINQLYKFYDTLKKPDFSFVRSCDIQTQNLERVLHPNPIGDINLCFNTHHRENETIGQVYFRKYDDKYKVILMRY
jgi:hypothetical protein